jgi:hypothetical protein
MDATRGEEEITVWPKMLKCYSRVGGGSKREKVLEHVTADLRDDARVEGRNQAYKRAKG